jgi:hypothetical protein
MSKPFTGFLTNPQELFLEDRIPPKAINREPSSAKYERTEHENGTNEAFPVWKLDRCTLGPVAGAWQ